jgi:hypothetical protein
MATRRAYALETLLKQYNALYPKRSKVSDGWIGDTAHQSAGSASDHNPDANGIVRAQDFTHDPANGMDCNVESLRVVNSLDPRTAYLIWNRRIWEPGKGWNTYTGKNPHDKHMHLSVKAANGDDASPWKITSEGEPVVYPSEQEVLDTFETYLPTTPKPDDAKIKYYTARDKWVLLQDVLLASRPSKGEVEAAFKKANQALKPQDAAYYSARPASVLYKDLLTPYRDPTAAEKLLNAIKEAVK